MDIKEKISLEAREIMCEDWKNKEVCTENEGI